MLEAIERGRGFDLGLAVLGYASGDGHLSAITGSGVTAQRCKHRCKRRCNGKCRGAVWSQRVASGRTGFETDPNLVLMIFTSGQYCQHRSESKMQARNLPSRNRGRACDRSHQAGVRLCQGALRGLAKNAHRLLVTCALANLFMARRQPCRRPNTAPTRSNCAAPSPVSKSPSPLSMAQPLCETSLKRGLPFIHT
jgi:hypothetical protein